MRYVIIFCLTLLCLFSPEKTKASHAAGGELFYEWVSDSTYRVIFKFYRDCTGAAEPPSVDLCAMNTCNSQWLVRRLNKMFILPDGSPNGMQIGSGCPGYPNTCDVNNAPIPGYREWWYADTITLNARCVKWVFSISISARNPSQNISGSLFYVEATINNQDFQGNSSAYFSTKPVPFVCINDPYTYNNGVVDKNNDSLAFEVLTPINSNMCTPAANCTYNAKNPPLSLPNNPFQTNNTYQLNPTTGNISFTAAELGAQTISIRSSEYRKGKLVGTVIRDIQVRVLNCTATPVALNIIPSTISGATQINNTIEVCAYTPFSFCYNIKATDTAAILVASDNHNVSMPVSNTGYTNNATDSVRGCFTWTASLADTGIKILTVVVKDSTCRAPGIAVTRVFTIPVKVKGVVPPVVVSPVEYCQNTPAQLLTATGTNLLWHNTPSGGTSTAIPPLPSTTLVGSTTFYTSRTAVGCTSIRLPIQVLVHHNAYSNISISDDTVCVFDDVILTNVATNTAPIFNSWVIDSARIIDGDSTAIITLDWNMPGIKKIYLRAFNAYCSNQDSALVYIYPVPKAYFHALKNICINQPTTIEPFEEKQAVYKWSVQEKVISDTAFKPSYVFSWNNPGKKYISLTLTNDAGCNATFLDSIGVHTYPVAKIVENNGELCYGKEFVLSTKEEDRYQYSWSPPQYFRQNGLTTVTGVAEQTGYVYLAVANQWNCTSVDSFFVNAKSCCDIFMPDAFTPNNDGWNDNFGSPDLQKHQLVRFMVANRRGQIVYDTNTPGRGWDGFYNGQKAGADTYNYYIQYKCSDNQEEMVKKGAFILLR